MILDYFDDEMNQVFSVYPYASGLDADGDPIQGYSAAASLSNIACAFYEGGAAESFVSSKYKTRVSGVAITYPGIAVPDKSKLILGNGREFSVIHADDVMYQGEVLVIALENPDNGAGI